MSRVAKTRNELRSIIAEQLSKILGSNITSEGLHDRPTRLKDEDVINNLHLFERLGTAYEALKALNHYYDHIPRGYQVKPEKNNIF